MTALNFNGIEFEVLDTLVAKRFAKFLEENLHESKEFYFMGEQKEEIKSEIDKIVYMLGKEPTNDLNALHEYFADHEDDPEMSRLNNLIHYYELVEQGYPPRWGYMAGNTTMQLFSPDYSYFTLTRKPGYLYINYPHVGKHFAEIAFSKDYNIKKEQYVPQDICRPSFFCWLGEEVAPNDTVWERIEETHTILKDKLDLPDLKDPALRVGYIPFAKLLDDINTNELTNHLLKCKKKSINQWELFTNGR